jgi:sarcosine oxidase
MHVAVFGAGAFGVWSALSLRRLGADVTLIDRWGAGNGRSSSGGETRIIRATYGPDRIYSEMVRRSFPLWGELDAGPSEPLYVETGLLWMHRSDDDSYVRASLPILHELDFAFEPLGLDEAAQRYPQISFEGVQTVWLEHRAGALAAKRACGVVREELAALGGIVRTAAATVRRTESSIEVTVDGTRLDADAHLFACGPWLGTLFPDVVGEHIRPTRQEVFYFGTPGGDDYLPTRMPAWIEFGERIIYGIPDTHGRGIKVADDTRGESFDPTDGDRTPSIDGAQRARDYVERRFPELAGAPLLASEVCQYENSPDGHLIFARHPHAANIWLLGGGSGHGFKLSPAVGEMAAAAILEGAAIPSLFRLDRLSAIERASTQFEAKTDAS